MSGKDVVLFFRVCSEMWRGLYFLRRSKRCVSIFGSARFPETHVYSELAREVAKAFVQRGYSVMTGGGPGIMQAANRGAFEAGGQSIGVNIILPHEQGLNPFLTRSFKCRYFFVRKLLLVRYSEVFVFLPGGFGTLDEFFEIITLLQTGRSENRPVILIGNKYWSELLDWCRRMLIPAGTITEAELARIQIVDSAQEAMALVP